MDFNNNGRNHLFLIKLFQRNGLMKYFEIDLCIHSHNWIWPQLNGIYRRRTERYITFFGSLSIKGYKFKNVSLSQYHCFRVDYYFSTAFSEPNSYRVNPFRAFFISAPLYLALNSEKDRKWIMDTDR